jgi:hypothetical protein
VVVVTVSVEERNSDVTCKYMCHGIVAKVTWPTNLVLLTQSHLARFFAEKYRHTMDPHKAARTDRRGVDETRTEQTPDFA